MLGISTPSRISANPDRGKPGPAPPHGAPIASYTATRRAVRELIAEHGAFIEIHVATPLEVCEAHDRKGLYEKARKGLIPEFTGISDPYESPEHPEIRLDTTNLSPVEAAQEIFLFLLREGYLD